jgi:hypothetical protein
MKAHLSPFSLNGQNACDLDLFMFTTCTEQVLGQLHFNNLNLKSFGVDSAVINDLTLRAIKFLGIVQFFFAIRKLLILPTEI